MQPICSISQSAPTLNRQEEIEKISTYEEILSKYENVYQELLKTKISKSDTKEIIEEKKVKFSKILSNVEEINNELTVSKEKLFLKHFNEILDKMKMVNSELEDQAKAWQMA